MGDTPKTKTDEDKLIIGHQRSGAGKGVQLRRPRSNAYNAEKQDRFFNRLSDTANVSAAARHAGAAVATVRHWRLTDALFRARWDQALADGYADLEMQMISKALFGIESETVEAVDAKGRMVRRTRSDAGGASRASGGDPCCGAAGSGCARPDQRCDDRRDARAVAGDGSKTADE